MMSLVNGVLDTGGKSRDPVLRFPFRGSGSVFKLINSGELADTISVLSGEQQEATSIPIRSPRWPTFTDVHRPGLL
jgi:hypothetical protein